MDCRSELNEKITKFIKNDAQKHHITNIALEKAIGVSHEQISRYLNCKNPMPLWFLFAYMKHRDFTDEEVLEMWRCL